MRLFTENGFGARQAAAGPAAIRLATKKADIVGAKARGVLDGRMGVGSCGCFLFHGLKGRDAWFPLYESEFFVRRTRPSLG